MKKLLIVTGALALFAASPAYAIGDCIGNNNCQDNDPITNTATGGAATGGNATNTNVNAPVTSIDIDADHYTRIYNQPRIDVDTTDVNVNSNKQGQLQGQLQGQHQKVDDSGNSTIIWNEKRDVAQAYAASAGIASDSCGTGVGAGGQGPGFGFTLNFARDDEVCELIKLSRRVGELGFNDGAIKLLCQDERVAEAMPAQCGAKQ